jgi:hypothetical protein
LLSSGVPIDEDLAIPGVAITPGNFTGVCPPFCAPPEVKPTSLLAGAKVNISVAFYVSNPLPEDGQIEVELHPKSRLVGDLLVSPGSVLDGTRENVEQVGPVLDGNLLIFLHGKTLRVRRDGTGRRIQVGEMVSLTIQGVQNQEDEGFTGTAHLWTKQSDGTVIDESVVPGPMLVPVEFLKYSIEKDNLDAGGVSKMYISFSTSGPIKPGSNLIVDFSNEKLKSTSFHPLDADSLALDGASLDWRLSIDGGVRLVLLYQGVASIPGGVRTKVSVANVPNPAAANTFEYKNSLFAPGSNVSTDVYQSLTYEAGGLWQVLMSPVSLLAGFTGEMTVSFKVLNPLPVNARIQIDLPNTFAFKDTVNGLSAVVSADSEMDGMLMVTKISSTRVSMQREFGSILQAGGKAAIIIYTVRNQEFSGITPQLKVTTFTSEHALIDVGKSAPIVLSVSKVRNAAIKFDTAVASSVDKATVAFTATSPIPIDGQVLVQFPAGTEVLNLPEYMSFMGQPVKVTIYPGTPAPTDVRLFSLSEGPLVAAKPYFTMNSTHAQAPSPVDSDEFRGASVLLSRLGGPDIVPNTDVVFMIPNIRVRPWTGFSGTFQIMTMLSTFELIDLDDNVSGLTINPAVFKDVAIKVSSLVSGKAVTVSINLTLSNPLPPTSEIHVTFPAGYRTIEYAQVSSHEGLLGLVKPIGIAPVVGGGKVLKLRHTHSAATPEGTRVFLVLTDIVNRFFSSRSQYFQIDTYRGDGVTHMEQSRRIVVPTTSDLAGAPGFGVVVESDRVMIFDSHDPSQATVNLRIQEGIGTVTHGVSAFDRLGDVVYFIAGGNLMALELFSPTLIPVLLKSGAGDLLGFVSMEWDVIHDRLVGLALVDGEMSMCTVDVVSGNVTRLAPLPACGTYECSPSQGVSALDAARNIYYMTSQVAVVAVNASTGALISQASVVQGDEGFLGFASLEFDGQGHHPLYVPLGLMGVALRGDMVELVQINPETGSSSRLANIFDDSFTGQIVGGISALAPGNSHYMLLAQSRLLAIDLETRVVTCHSPYSAGASSAWAFLEMSRFLPPVDGSYGNYVNAETGTNSLNDVKLPVPLTKLNITVVGLTESLPVKRGSVASGNFFSIQLLGSDVAAGDKILVSRSGDCSRVLPGGGPFTIMSKGKHQQAFYLELADTLPMDAQLCYSRPDGFDAAFRALPYGGTSGAWLVDFPTTMALFTVKQIPLPVGTPVSMTFSGALAAGDTFRIVKNDLSINPVDLCSQAPLYGGTTPVSVVSVDPQQMRSYVFGAVTEIVTDVLLEDVGGAELAVCYRPAASSSFALISGRYGASSSNYTTTTLMPVAAGDGQGSTVAECAANTASSPYSSAML